MARRLRRALSPLDGRGRRLQKKSGPASSWRKSTAAKALAEPSGLGHRAVQNGGDSESPPSAEYLPSYCELQYIVPRLQGESVGARLDMRLARLSFLLRCWRISRRLVDLAAPHSPAGRKAGEGASIGRGPRQGGITMSADMAPGLLARGCSPAACQCATYLITRGRKPRYESAAWCFEVRAFMIRSSPALDIAAACRFTQPTLERRALFLREEAPGTQNGQSALPSVPTVQGNSYVCSVRQRT